MCAVWSIDAGDMETALRLSSAAISQQQLAPEHFKRDLTTFIIEEVADWAERQIKAGLSASPYVDDVCNKIESGQWLSDNVIALGKVFKNAGINAEKNGDDKEALEYFRRALDENEKSGVKKRIKDLEEKLG